jgi:NhaP-type Na+/H+ or K+/H+ antiporter
VDYLWLLVLYVMMLMVRALMLAVAFPGLQMLGEKVGNLDVDVTTLSSPEHRRIPLMLPRTRVLVPPPHALTGAWCAVQVTWQEAVFMWWGGLRGAVGLALAIVVDRELLIAERSLLNDEGHPDHARATAEALKGKWREGGEGYC